jgi:predicted cation transporter
VGLVLIGFGFEPLIVWYIAKVPHWGLYWINLSSAVLDNAAMTALEIDPTMTLLQIISATIAILVAGGMLTIGNMSNVIVSTKLKLTMKEWARVGIPLGLIVMIIYFIILIFLFP